MPGRGNEALPMEEVLGELFPWGVWGGRWEYVFTLLVGMGGDDNNNSGFCKRLLKFTPWRFLGDGPWGGWTVGGSPPPPPRRFPEEIPDEVPDASLRMVARG